MLRATDKLWSYFSSHQKELIEDGEKIFSSVGDCQNGLHDYSYAIFPYAKAFEGFLKKLFFDLGFIDEHVYRGEKFRIGKALNPHLEHLLRHESMYDKLVTLTGSNELSERLWNTWKMGRNLLFHYFPHNVHKITLEEAEITREDILRSMEMALERCFHDKQIPTNTP